MKSTLLTPIALKLTAILVIFIAFTHSVKSQNAADYEFSASTRAYAPITGGTVISNNPDDNNQFFENLNIGFDFRYFGTNYTQIGASINGFASFSNGTGITYPLFNGLNNSMSPLSGNLQAKPGSELRIQTLGNAPNRICVIQWKDYRWNGGNENYNFQIRLSESSNSVEFHYGNFTNTGDARPFQVTINRTNADFQNRTLQGNSDWNTTNTISDNRQNGAITVSGTIKPTNGLVFSFAPPYADLFVNIAANTANPCVGQELIYEINLTNNGPNPTQNTIVNFSLPNGLTLLEGNAEVGNYNAGSGNWTINNLNNGQNAKLFIRASVNADQGGNNISATTGILSTSMSDNNSANNTSNLTVAVSSNNIPEISNIANQSVGYNQVSAPINFTISDIETATEDLILSVASSNTTVLPLSGLVITGTGENRVLTITAGLNQFGTSDISIEVSDGTCSKLITFNVEVFKQSYSNFESAKIVVGQVDFNTVNTNASQINAPGSNSSAVSAKGVLAVGSQTTNRVLIWNSVPDSDGVPANIVIGQNTFTSTGAGNNTRGLDSPNGVTFSPDGNKIIVADSRNNRLLIWNNIPTSNNQPADVVVGQNNFTSYNPSTGANRLNSASDVQVTPSGKMIVTDRGNSRVLIFNKIPTTNGASADVVIGQNDFAGNGTGTAINRLRTPWNTSITPDGKLVIADDENNRILIYNTIPTTNGANADVVVGQIDFSGRNPGVGANKFFFPGVTVSPSGVMAVADFSNHRALIFNEVPTTNNASADIVLGQRNFTENVSFNNGSGGSGTASNRNMSQPYGINFDLNERLYINGRNMNRMMIYGETPSQAADLSLSFASDNGNPCVNGLVSYTVNVTNNGPNSGTNVIVTSALPFGFTPVESIISSGTYNQNSGFWTIPLIRNGETVSLEMQGTVNLGENLNSITAYASVRSYNQVDTDFSNNSGTVTVVVENNMAPTITTINDAITDFNTPTASIPFTVADTETNAGALTVSAQSSNPVIIPNTNIVFSGTGANRSVVITPINNQFGTVTITLTVQDGTCSTNESFDVFVGNVWLGYSTDWKNASNWSTGVPSTTMSAFIPASPIGGNYPVLNSNEPVFNLGIGVGARINVNATRILNVYGDFYNDGSQTTGNGIINIRGGASQQFRGIVGALTINNSNGAILSGNTTIQGVLNLTDGNLTIGANTITIKNPITGQTSNLRTNGTSSIAIEGSTAGINIPAQVSQLLNLTLNNGNGLTLNGNLTLAGELTLNTGSLRMNENDLTLNGNINSLGGNLSGDINSNLTISGTGNSGTLTMSTTNNYLNNFEFDRDEKNITLENDLKIVGSLLLSNGIVKTSNGIIWVENNSPNAIPFYSETAYVNGKLRRCVIEGQAYNFPVGSPNHLENAWIDFSALSEATCIDAEFMPGINGSSPENLAVGDNKVDGILDYGFWRIKPTNTNATIEYKISVTSIGHNNGAQEQNHILLKRADETQPWAILGDHTLENEGGDFENPITVSRTNLIGFSDFSVGVSSDGPLPITLTYFKGRIANNAAELTWQTASEIDNDYFEIEKSTDGEQFEMIGLVQGQGTKHAHTDYVFYDKDDNSGKTFYRFKQVDYNGDFSYSSIVIIEFREKVGRISIYPNPVRDIVTINFEDSNILDAQITIYDNIGRLIMDERKHLEFGKIPLDLGRLPSGSYQMRTVSQTATGPVISHSKLIKN